MTDDMSILDKAVMSVMSRPLSSEELKGFGRPLFNPPKVIPLITFNGPSKTDGPKGYAVFVGIEGKF